MTDKHRPHFDIDQIEANFTEISPAMTDTEALAEANRCLYCYDAPCTRACPTHIDVPAFIKKIASGNVTGSARVIFDANPIGSTCARVCPVEVLCEGACVEKTLVNKPIEIGRLQRYATDHALQHNKDLFEKCESNGKSVGIIGSGPAGLSCAMYLARLGYTVTVYDLKAKPGGLNTYGMAEYKMTQAASLSEIERIARLGVEFRLNTRVVSGDREIVGPPDEIGFELVEDRHEAIFLALGLGETNSLGVPGEDLEGVIDALTFIEKVKTRDWLSVPLGKNVVVIGAGNTAVDAATQAKRLGAEQVTMIYRRTVKEAPAYDYEMELARKDGIRFIWQTSPVEIIGAGHVSGIRLINSAGKESKVACDQVIKAIGQQKNAAFFTDVVGVEIDKRGVVLVDEHMRTSNPKIFAGGDCANGGKEAVDAAQMGKLAAQGIHLSLTGEAVRFAGG